MRKGLCLILLMGLLATPVIAIANDHPYDLKMWDVIGLNHLDLQLQWEASTQCSLIPTKASSEDGGKIYINPKQISHLITVTDTASVSTGTSGRYILMVSMTNGNVILYGRYLSDRNRRNSIKYLYDILLVCNQQKM